MSFPIWRQPDGEPVSCRDKLKVLQENHLEVLQALHDAFEDAVLMGVDADSMKDILVIAVQQLRSPMIGGT